MADTSGIPIDLILAIVVMIVVFGIIMSIMGKIGISDIIMAKGVTRRTQLDTEPRDHAERCINANRKVAREQKPRHLKEIWATGDMDVSPFKVGNLFGVIPHQEGYWLYSKKDRLRWSKPISVPRRFCGDLNGRILWIAARGFGTQGLYRFPLPPTPEDPNQCVKDAERLYIFIFGLQSLTDSREDIQWSAATGIMPRVRDRVMAAEVEMPHVVERQYMPEQEYAGRGPS